MALVDFDLVVLATDDWNPVDDNVDVEVAFLDGSRYTATFFTIENIRSLFAKNKNTGECAGGTYLWATEMILVEKLDIETMRATVHGLIRDGELDVAFTRVPDVARIASDGQSALER